MGEQKTKQKEREKRRRESEKKKTKWSLIVLVLQFCPSNFNSSLQFSAKLFVPSIYPYSIELLLPNQFNILCLCNKFWLSFVFDINTP